jgi:hypothetical protein
VEPLDTVESRVSPHPPLSVEVIGRAIQTSLPSGPVAPYRSMFDRRACLPGVANRHNDLSLFT